jgi:two-component system, sensor histidine kinase YesM
METAGFLQDSGYKRRLFARYFGVTLIPVFFFLVTGTLSVILAQRSVSRELVSLNLRNLGQVKDAFELILNETNSLALSLSTDPEFYLSAEQILTTRLVTVDDLRRQRWLTSGINSAVNTRQYLHSIYVSLNNQPDRLVTTTDSVTDAAGFADAEWRRPALGREREIGFWLAYRPLRVFASMPWTLPVLTLYRNMLGASSFENKGIIALNLKLDYFQRMLDSMSEQGRRRYVIFDASGRAIVKSGDFVPVPVSGERVEITVDGASFIASSLDSSRFPFTYCSYAPAREVYRLSDTLLKLSLIFATVSLVAGLLLMYAAARRSFRSIGNIVDIIQAAERGVNLPRPVLPGHNSFSSLTYSILKTFVEREYLRLRQVNLELLALQSQMNPHFLYNTLTTISCKALEFTGSPNGVTEMIGRLARILAYSLESPQAGVRLSDEIVYTRDYLEIQRIRSHDGFRVEWEIGAGTEECRLPRLLLQPLVENAIDHGFRSHQGQGRIRVCARRDADRLELSVDDNGVGIPKEELAAVRACLTQEGAPDGHIGLPNTGKRLRLFFPGMASVEIDSGPEGGTIVRLVMPAVDA